MFAESAFFYIFAIVAVAGAVAVVLIPNTALGAIFLVVVIVSSAVLFGILDAHFMAAVQVLVYAGAIAVLFLFTIVFLNVRKNRSDFGPAQIPKKLTFLLPLAVFAAYFGKKIAPFALHSAPPGEFDGTVSDVATLLLTDYLLAFEVTSLLIVAAIVGTVAISRGLR